MGGEGGRRWAGGDEPPGSYRWIAIRRQDDQFCRWSVLVSLASDALLRASFCQTLGGSFLLLITLITAVYEAPSFFKKIAFHSSAYVTGTATTGR